MIGVFFARFPSARWTGEQFIRACPDGSEPRYLLQDRDWIYGEEYKERIQAFGIKEVITAPRSPWQKPFCERHIGTFVVLNKRTVMWPIQLCGVPTQRI
jgi:hypothetical protein